VYIVLYNDVYIVQYNDVYIVLYNDVYIVQYNDVYIVQYNDVYIVQYNDVYIVLYFLMFTLYCICVGSHVTNDKETPSTKPLEVVSEEKKELSVPFSAPESKAEPLKRSSKLLEAVVIILAI